MTPNLALLVRASEVDETLDAIRSEGIYDRDRRIRSRDPESVEIPITDHPDAIEIGSVIEQSSPAWRTRTLGDRLRNRGWSDEEIGHAPQSWSVIGSVIVLRQSECPRLEEVGEALLELHGEADTVIQLDDISGRFRDPTTRILAGVGETETTHREHGIEYALDLSSVMFSPGNKNERRRMGDLVRPGEHVFDMFAGIGYFTLPMASAGARVTASEINPVAYRYLIENVMLNDLSGVVDAYFADCRSVDVSADRIVMGYYDAPEYLDAAVAAIDPPGYLHLHALAPVSKRWDKPTSALQGAVSEVDLSVSVERRSVVKTHSPGVEHVVIDALIR